MCIDGDAFLLHGNGDAKLFTALKPYVVHTVNKYIEQPYNVIALLVCFTEPNWIRFFDF